MIYSIVSIICTFLIALWGIVQNNKNKNSEKFSISKAGIIIALIAAIGVIFSILNEIQNTKEQSKLTSQNENLIQKNEELSENLNEFRNKSEQNQARIEGMVQIANASGDIDFRLSSLEILDTRCVGGNTVIEAAVEGGVDYYVLVKEDGSVISKSLNSDADFLTFTDLPSGIFSFLVFQNDKIGAYHLVSYCGESK